MKRRFLIIALCFICAASFAQTKGKPTTTKPKPKPGTTKKTVTKPDSAAIKAAANNTQKTADAVQPPVNKPAETAAKTPAGPVKPFERPVDGYYKKSDIMNARVTPLAPLREVDVPYKRRVWREIDLRDIKNQYMASPKSRLIDIIMDAVSSGELTAYDPTPTKDDIDGDAFGAALTPEKAKLRMADSSVISTFDKNGDKSGSRVVAGEFNPDSVIKFRIKEDIIFDKQRSVQEYRIIGIAPLVKPKIDGTVAGVSIDYQPAFWIYFPDARKILVTKEVVNSHNDATGLSYDDVFTKRAFTSYIVKQSNDKDESIKNYAQGIDKLYESERIKKTLMDWELSLWQY